jgi:CRISPR/Cas system-associated endonuclease Cas1
MPATQNVRQLPQSHNSVLIASRHGVVTLFGYGIQVRVDRGHLLAECGIGAGRHRIKLSRVGHELKRLICVSEDGFITLNALKWLSDVGASFVMLNRKGKILLVTGPAASSDGGLHRAQALALGNGAGLEICRVLIDAKLRGQEQVIRERLNAPASAEVIDSFRRSLPAADTFEAIRQKESQAAVAYFAALRDIPVLWPKADLAFIPEHWRTVGSRQSPLTGAPRLAVTPVHAVLNYCFALLEAETRIAVSAVGLDPCLALGLHTDSSKRDSLVFDVLEPVRPQIESWVLNWIQREGLRRADFLETSTGNCRLRSHLCARLSETAPTWGKLVGPWAEFVARALWTRKSGATNARLATPLTQQHRRQAKGNFELPKAHAPRPMKTCRGCGVELHGQRDHCSKCGVDISRANMIEIAHRGRILSKSTEALAKQSVAQKRQRAARRGWNPSSLPAWLTREGYRKMILPSLAEVTIPRIAAAINVSDGYASRLRKGLHVPHPMHWEALARLGGVTAPL